MPKKVPQDKFDESAGSDEESLSQISDDEDEEGQEDESSLANSFIASEDETVGRNLALERRRAADEALDKIERDRKERQMKEQRYPVDLEEEEHVELLQVDAKDPNVYRIIVRRGTAQKCVLAMTMFVAKHNRKVELNQQIYGNKLNIISISCANNDLEGVKIEAYNPIDVERLAGHGLFKSYVVPFKRQFGPQPHTKRVQILKQLSQLDRKDEQMMMFSQTFESEMDLKVNQFCVIKRASIKQLKGALCRIHELDSKRGLATVLTLTPFRSLNSREIVQMHRISLEEYKENGKDAKEFQQSIQFPSGAYLQGLLVLEIPYERLGQLKSGGAYQLETLNISGVRNAVAEVGLNFELRALQLGDKVVVNQHLMVDELTGSIAVVKELRDDYGYQVEILQAEKVENIGRLLYAERFQLTKFVKINDHIKVDNPKSPFKGLTGNVVNLLEANNKLIVEFKADIIDELIDRSYGICADDCTISNEHCSSLDEVMFGEKIFRKKDQLVKTSNGDDAIITFLLYKSARILTSENQVLTAKLADLQPMYFKKNLKIAQDGSNPALSISINSKVLIKGSNNRGNIVQILIQQQGAVVFVDISSGEAVGVVAVPAKSVIREDPGPIITKNKMSQVQMLVGEQVRLSDPSYMGRIGTFIGEVGEGGKKILVQLAEKKIAIERRWVHVIKNVQELVDQGVAETQRQQGIFDQTQGQNLQTQFDQLPTQFAQEDEWVAAYQPPQQQSQPTRQQEAEDEEMGW